MRPQAHVVPEGLAPDARQSPIRRVAGVVESRAVQWVIVICYSYFFAIILFEVVMRYVFSASTSWGEMTARYTHVYFAYLAAAEAFRHDGHIRVDYFPNRLSGRSKLALEAYIDLLCLGVAVAVAYFSLKVVVLQIEGGFQMQSLPLNMAFATAAVPIGWTLMSIRIVQRFARRWSLAKDFSPTSHKV